MILYIIFLIIITIGLTIYKIHRNGEVLDIILIISLGVFNLTIMKTKLEYLYSYNGIENGYYGGGTSLETILIACVPQIIIIIISNIISYHYKIRQLKKWKKELDSLSKK